MNFTKAISRWLMTLGLAAAFAPALALADTYTWKFASQNVSGTGTLNAIAYGNPGKFLITGGSGTIADTTYGTISVTITPCATPNATCTVVNTDNAGANLTYDDLLFPVNAPGSQLDDNGIVLSPGPAGTNYIGIFDSPSQEFYNYSTNGYQNLTTPFTVTPFVAATPEPTSLVLVGSGLLGVYYRFKRRNP